MSNEETKRGRVRRLLITPLTDDGMRFRHGTNDEMQKRILNRLCDELARCTDDVLEIIRIWAQRNAEGAGRCFWPQVQGFLATAEILQPRPVEDIPALANWFGSRAGPAAKEAGTLVAEYEFIRQKKVPPTSETYKRKVMERAQEWRRRLELCVDRQNRGVVLDEQDQGFVAWYRDVERAALGLIEAGDRKRAGEGAP